MRLHERYSHTGTFLKHDMTNFQPTITDVLADLAADVQRYYDEGCRSFQITVTERVPSVDPPNREFSAQIYANEGMGPR